MVVVALAQLAAAFPRGEQSAGYHRLPTRKTLPPLSLLIVCLYVDFVRRLRDWLSSAEHNKPNSLPLLHHY